MKGVSSDGNNAALVLACNDRYAPYCAATWLSALSASSTLRDFPILIFSRELSALNIERMRNLAQQHGATIEFRTVSDNLIKTLPDALGVDTYLRLLIPEAIHGEYARCLYLDSDMIVKGDLTELLSSPVPSPAIVAAVPNGAAPFIESFRRQHGLPEDAPVFNGGLLWIDVQRWCGQEIGQRIIRWTETQRDSVLFGDQDGINVILQGKIHELPGKWNWEVRLLKEKVLGVKHGPGVREDAEAAAVYHFTGPDKPWVRWRYTPCRASFDHIFKTTPWAKASLRLRIKDVINELRGLAVFAMGMVRFRLGAWRQRLADAKGREPTGGI
jgi:lipopolysaccharide biosynthesis glycosyltransferase